MKRFVGGLAATISELRANPSKVIREAKEEPVLIMRHKEPRAYLVPADTFERMHEELEDFALLQEATERMNDESIPMKISKLREMASKK